MFKRYDNSLTENENGEYVKYNDVLKELSKSQTIFKGLLFYLMLPDSHKHLFTSKMAYSEDVKIIMTTSFLVEKELSRVLREE